jgi:hypothetical protein
MESEPADREAIVTDLQVPVIGTDTGYLYVGHGDRCILIGEMDVPKWRNATGLTSEAARRLAAILVQQADAADQLVGQP